MDLFEIADLLSDEIHNIPDPEIKSKDLDEAAYTMSECGILSDETEMISPQQIIQCWKLVEFIKKEKKFPKKYRM